MKKFLLSMILAGLATTLAMAYGNGDSVKIGGYTNNSYWTGIVYETSNDNYKVKVTDVVTNGFLMLHLNPGTCTGGIQLGYSQIGEYVWIPKYCTNN